MDFLDIVPSDAGLLLAGLAVGWVAHMFGVAMWAMTRPTGGNPAV